MNNSSSKNTRPREGSEDNILTNQTSCSISDVSDNRTFCDLHNGAPMEVEHSFETGDALAVDLGYPLASWGDIDFEVAQQIVPNTDDRELLMRSWFHTGSSRAQVPDFLYPPKSTIPPVPDLNSRSLVPRTWSGGQRVCGLILQALKSFPRMLATVGGSLPPFLHPHLAATTGSPHRSETLDSCTSLLYMLSHKTQASRKLFWRNVKTECERVIAEHTGLDKWGLLAALQAMCIYMIIRLDEGETEYNNLERLLTTATIVLSKQFQRELSCSCIDSSKGQAPNWEDWLYEESARRLSVVYKVMNMLVYFEPVSLCDLQTNLVLGPLPASKPLWEASNQLTWQTAMRKQAESEKTFGLAATGQLVELDPIDAKHGKQEFLMERWNLRIDCTAPTWDEWCSGIDGLGSIVMLAASLVA